MALTGLEIYKLLPKTNCGKCGVPTCLAFAMALAGKKISLEKCPDVSLEARAALESASAPPIQLVSIGTAPHKIEIGNETVLFRHEQTFYHPTGLAVQIPDNLTEEEITQRINRINHLVFERVGREVRIDLVALADRSNHPTHFAQIAKKLAESSPLALILVSENSEVLEEALKIVGSRRPLLCGANSENYQRMVELAKKYNCPLAVTGKNLDELAELTLKITSLGVNQLVINPGSTNLSSLLADITQIRRLSLKKNFRPLGFPVIIRVPEGIDSYQQTLYGLTFIPKYGGIIIFPEMEPWQALVLVTLRLNIYTDPQKPIQLEPKVYSIGNVKESSPVLVTTNFSLTYFTVAPEVEASRIASYILVVNTEGMSVLTAYAADKLNEKTITQAIKDNQVGNLVNHRRLIIPGYISVLSGKIEAESGWEVLVGPREAPAIPSFLKQVWKI